MACSKSAELCLSEAQENAVNSIIANITNDSGPSVLCGYAGTGKTVSTAALVSRLVGVGKKVVVATPTHKARSQVERALRARGASNFDVVTVHRLLGLKQCINWDTGEETFKADPKGTNMLKEKSRWDEDLRENVPVDPIEVVIIDETSMLQSSLYGLLLKEAKGMHLVFVGDDRQLLPVGEQQVCPAFTKSPSVYRLTEVLRHDGAILNLATATRNLELGRPRFESATGGETRVVAYERPEDWLAALLQTASKEEAVEDADYCRVLALSNKAVEEMNSRIHQYIYGFNAPEYAPGMVCVTCDAVPDPLGGRTLLHSTVDLMIEAAELQSWRPQLVVNSRDRWGLPKYDQPSLPKEIEAFFDEEQQYKSWSLAVEVFADNELPLHIRTIARSHEAQWSEAQNFISSQAKKTDDKQLRKTLWQLFYNRKNQIARIQPASALTVHKSQGSTFRHVFLHPSIDDMANLQNQLAYVGITRAAETLHVIADR